MLKKVVLTLVLLVLVGSFLVSSAVVGVAAEKDEDVLIGIIFPHPESPFIQNMLKSVTIASEKYGWKAILRTPSTSEEIERFNTLIQDLAIRCDALVIQSMEIGSAAAYSKRAMDDGVFVVHTNWDQASPIEGAFLTVMGVSQFGGGEAVGKELGKMAPAGSKGVYLGGTPGYHSTERGNGFEAGFTSTNQGGVVLGQANTQWTRETGYDAMMDLLQRFPDLNVVYGAADEIALGAIEALRHAGRLEDVLVGGFDANPNAVMAIKMGDLTASVSIAPLEMAVESVRVIKAAMEAKKYGFEDLLGIPPVTIIPPIVVTKENADAFLQKYIDFGIPVEE